MLVLSPLTNSNPEAKEEGFSDAFLPDDDFLDSIDFSCIFEGFDVDNIGEHLFPTDDHPQVLLSELPQQFSAEEEQEKSHSQEREQNKKDESTCAKAPPMPVKRSHGKKKVKVDWTPELHRSFVQAVEQLGVDKAVPSRILEIMGIHNLTRHNVASHLQKYRSHRKHLLAREAEAASWSQRRQIIYAVGAGGGNVKSIIKKENSPWVSPTIGYPPSLHTQLIRPLHVWGHPTVADRPPLGQAMWPRHTPPHPWPPQPANYIAYWQPHYQGGAAEGWGPSAVISAPHFMPHAFPTMRFAPPVVAGVPPHPMYRSQHWVSPLKKHSNLQPEHGDYPLWLHQQCA